jgi:hypothetical protein
MDFRNLITRQGLATFAACLGLLLLAAPAGARTDLVPAQQQTEESDALARYLANHRAHEERASQTTPRGQSDAFMRYLAVGVADATSSVTLRERPDGFQPQLHTDASVQVAGGDGFEWETTGFVGAGLAGAMLLALLSTLALRSARGLRGAHGG